MLAWTIELSKSRAPARTPLDLHEKPSTQEAGRGVGELGGVGCRTKAGECRYVQETRGTGEKEQS